MATPANGTPKLTGHNCQNGCGRLAAYVMVDLEDSSVNIMCAPCTLGFWAKIIETVPQVLDAPGIDTDQT
jgi:hypothetical protein